MEGNFEFQIIAKKADKITVSVNREEFREAGDKKQKENYVKRLIRSKLTDDYKIDDYKIKEIKDFFKSQPDVPEEEFCFPVSTKEECEITVDVDMEKFTNANGYKEKKEYIKNLIEKEMNNVCKIEDYKIEEIEKYFEEIMSTSDFHPNETDDEYMDHENYDD